VRRARSSLRGRAGRRHQARFAAGKGNADKQAVIDAIRARGFSPVDHNEADAIAILLWAIETRGSAP
jgi:hypothetical protein